MGAAEKTARGEREGRREVPGEKERGWGERGRVLVDCVYMCMIEGEQDRDRRKTETKGEIKRQRQRNQKTKTKRNWKKQRSHRKKQSHFVL